jgi:monoamine oxidase
MDRRDFLRQSFLTGAGLLIPAGFAPAQVTPEARKVIVIGAGLAGLVAAYELTRLNYDVRLLEAQKRVGGRVLTIRDFDEGLYGEAGAARISRDHDLTLKYIDEFGLPLIPFYPADGQFMRLRKGRVEKIGWKKFVGSISPIITLGKQEYWKKIRGGNDLLPKAFAEKLGGKITFESPVVKIEQDRAGVKVHFKEKDTPQTLSGDLVISTIPFPMLATIDVTPPFSKAKAEVIRTITYESASRVLLETKNRFWHDSKVNGFALGENLAEVWEGSFGQGGTHGILQNYVRGDDSRALTRQASAERLTATQSALGKFFPGLGENYLKGFSKCWSEDAWTKGAWGILGGTRLETGKAPEGRIFFAGEHLSGHASWMQGALQSGLSAVEEIKKFRSVRANI